jgi:hypothetical protein
MIRCCAAPSFLAASPQRVTRQADRDAGKALLGRLPEKQQGQAVLWLPAHGILDDVTFPPKLTYDSSRAPKRGEAQRRVDLSPLNVAALKERLAHVEAEVKANDPKALRAQITKLKAELTKAAKNNQHPQSTPIDPKVIEAAEIRGWNAGVEATRQALIAKGRVVSDAVTAMLATAVPFKQSYLQRLGARELVEARGREVKASDHLFD